MTLAILNHMPLWAALAVLAALVAGNVIGWSVTRSDRRWLRERGYDWRGRRL